MRVLIGNSAAKEAYRDGNGNLKHRAIPGRRVTSVTIPDSYSLMEAVAAVTARDGVWNHHSQGDEPTDSSPDWVESDNEAVAGLLAIGRGTHRVAAIEMFDLLKMFAFILASWELLLRRRLHVLVPPGGRLSPWRPQRPSEDTGGAREHDPRDAALQRRLEDVERPRDVGPDKGAAGVGRHMGLVQRGRMQHAVYPVGPTADEVGIRDRADVGGERRIQQVDPDDLVPALLQGPDQRLAEMTGASCDQKPHLGSLPPRSPRASSPTI